MCLFVYNGLFVSQLGIVKSLDIFLVDDLLLILISATLFTSMFYKCSNLTFFVFFFFEDAEIVKSRSSREYKKSLRSCASKQGMLILSQISVSVLSEPINKFETLSYGSKHSLSDIVSNNA